MTIRIRHALLAAALLVPMQTSAQSANRRSADDYVCALTGECPPGPRAPAGQRRPLPPGGLDASAQGFRIATQHAQLGLAFPSGSSRLTPDAQAEVRTIATALRSPRLAGKRFRIEGHTDSLGDPAGNLRLSQQRAAVVATALMRLGVARARLESHGYGAQRPLRGVPANDATNRRVEAVVLP